MRRTATALCLAASLVPAAPVMAQQGFVEGFIGGVIASELGRAATRQSGGKRTRPADPAAAQRAAEQREEMRLIQTRLAALGYNVGKPDGVSGPRTRSAISEFQVSIGATPTGTLTDEQKVMLYEQSAGIGGAVMPPTTAYPALGTANGAPAATAAFPALGGPAAAPPAPSAFPALGGQPPATPPATSGFPALATPNAPPQAAAFPTIGTPAAPAAETAPLVAGSVQAAEAELSRTDFAAEVALTPFATVDAQPAVLGIGLGSTNEEFVASLRENGFGNCSAAVQAELCVRQTETLTDTVKGWTSEEGIWAIARLIQFTEPVPADFIREQFGQSYPELMDVPGGLISSGETCTIAAQGVHQLAALLDKRDDGNGAAAVPPDLLAVAAECPVAYSLAFNEGNGLVAAVQVLLFDGTNVVRQHLAANSARENKIGADLKF